MDENYTFVKNYNDGYFLTNPVLFAKNHYPLQKKWLLNNMITKTIFLNAPLIYAETFKYKIIRFTPSQMNMEVKENEEVSFRFKTLNNISNKKVSLVFFFGNKELNFKIDDLKIENRMISFKTKFKWKGFYDAHLKIGKDIVATYTIKVTKTRNLIVSRK